MTNFTSQQQDVIDHVEAFPDSHLMVSARAGTGKTYTIEHAAAGVYQDAIAVAFNKRIAEELATRVPANVKASTFNSLGHRAWGSKLRARLTLNADKVYQLTKKVIPEGTPDPDGDLFKTVLALVNGAKSVGLVPKMPGYPSGLVADEFESWDTIAFDRGFDATDEALAFARKVLLQSIVQANSGTIDFSDQIYMSALFGGVFTRAHTVIVDEAQDLSPLNHLMLKKLVGTRLIAVGDPYQAIYGFRGADSQSMPSLQRMFQPMEVLPLTQSFRVAKSVAARQISHVPDFTSHESCKQGEVQVWPLKDADGNRPGDWRLSEIPARGAVICRNNAPLMKLAFALIKSRRPVKILGRDIGASLANLLSKIGGRNLSEVSINTGLALVEDWKQKEIAKAGDRESKKEGINDRAESLCVLLEASGCQDLGGCETFIRELFSDKAEGLVLTSGHRAKGLEWDWVMHLDRFRIPSKFAKRQEAQGNHAPMEQELNLRYVIETRTKNVLVLANLDECWDVGDDS